MQNNIVKISIGIQARSTSERLPNKIMMDICGKPMIDWVIESAESSAHYMNTPRQNNFLRASTFVLMPYNDVAIPYVYKKCRVIEGDEHDVLSRYVRMAELENSDYIVRITGDCPMLPDAIISKAVNTITKNRIDYVSNVDERLRVSFDGQDVEIFSRRLLNYLNENATDKKEREHVTTHYRNNQLNLGKIFKAGHIIGYVNLKPIKLSVDTMEDIEFVREQKRDIINSIHIAEQMSGKQSVFRF